jgi:hypothetical protein
MNYRFQRRILIVSMTSWTEFLEARGMNIPCGLDSDFICCCLCFPRWKAPQNGCRVTVITIVAVLSVIILLFYLFVV